MNLINFRKNSFYRNLKDREARHGLQIRYYDIDGISCDSKYVPLFAPFINKGIYDRKIVHFSLIKPNIYNFHRALRTYNGLYGSLTMGTATRRFSTKSMEFNLLVIKGAIFEETDGVPKLLFSVVVEEEYMAKMFLERDNLDYSKFAMLVASDFGLDPKYKSVYRKMYKEVILPHVEMGVDMITTNNIVDKCFKNNLIAPKFKGVEEMNEYLSALNLEI